MESDEALAHSYLLFRSLYNTGTKPCIPITITLKQLVQKKIRYLALCSLKCSHIKQSGRQLHILSFHKMCFLLF
jgi:hypothetical protein